MDRRGQSERATRKRANVELKPPVGECCRICRPSSLGSSCDCPIPSLSLGSLAWKTQHSVGRGSIAGRQAPDDGTVPGSGRDVGRPPPPPPLAEQRHQKNKITRKKISPSSLLATADRCRGETTPGKREEGRSVRPSRTGAV